MHAYRYYMHYRSVLSDKVVVTQPVLVEVTDHINPKRSQSGPEGNINTGNCTVYYSIAHADIQSHGLIFKAINNGLGVLITKADAQDPVVNVRGCEGARLACGSCPKVK